MRYKCVPEEPTDVMLGALLGDIYDEHNAHDAYERLLAAAPPLPPELEEAVKVARLWIRDYSSATADSVRGEAVVLARALLIAVGRA